MFRKYRFVGEGAAKGSTSSDDISRIMSDYPLLTGLMAEDFAGDPDNYDPSDVESKLKQADMESEHPEEECAVFALEDENGGLVKVFVPKEQKEEFEQALAQALAAAKKQYEDDNEEVEIAEILFGLKDKFEIVNVVWPHIGEEDEEAVSAPQQSQGGAGTPPTEGGDEGEVDQAAHDLESGEPPAEGEEGLEGGDDLGGADGSDTGSILNKLLDMLKSQADAKKAEARAESNKYARDIAIKKMGQEEQVLDMDSYYEGKKKKEDESDKLIKLARYRNDVRSDKSRVA